MYNANGFGMFALNAVLFISKSEWYITCTNYKCGYTGPANVRKLKEKRLISKTKQPRKQKREYEIIKDSDHAKVFFQLNHTCARSAIVPKSIFI